MWPHLVVVVRVYYGAAKLLETLFLPTYAKFWPSRELWPNSNLVFVWDAESALDKKAAAALHAKWDQVILDARRGSRVGGGGKNHLGRKNEEASKDEDGGFSFSRSKWRERWGKTRRKLLHNAGVKAGADDERVQLQDSTTASSIDDESGGPPEFPAWYGEKQDDEAGGPPEFPAWYDVFEPEPDSADGHYCDSKKPGKLGYLRQVYSAWVTDRALRQDDAGALRELEWWDRYLSDGGSHSGGRGVGQAIKGQDDGPGRDNTNNTQNGSLSLSPSGEPYFVAYLDADMAFLGPMHPLELFDYEIPFLPVMAPTTSTGDTKELPNMNTMIQWRPQVMGYNVRCEEEAAQDLLFVHTPPLSCFMHGGSPPWIVDIRHFEYFRAAATQAVFANMHRFTSQLVPLNTVWKAKNGTALYFRRRKTWMMYSMPGAINADPSKGRSNVTQLRPAQHPVMSVNWRTVKIGEMRWRRRRGGEAAAEEEEEVVTEHVYADRRQATRAFFEQWRYAAEQRRFMSIISTSSEDEDLEREAELYREYGIARQTEEGGRAASLTFPAKPIESLALEELPFAEMYFPADDKPFTFENAWGMSYRCMFPPLARVSEYDRTVAHVTAWFTMLFHNQHLHKKYSWYLRDDTERDVTYLDHGGRAFLHRKVDSWNDVASNHRDLPDLADPLRALTGNSPVDGKGSIPPGINLLEKERKFFASGQKVESSAVADESSRSSSTSEVVSRKTFLDFLTILIKEHQQKGLHFPHAHERQEARDEEPQLQSQSATSTGITEIETNIKPFSSYSQTRYKMSLVQHAWYAKRHTAQQQEPLLEVLVKGFAGLYDFGQLNYSNTARTQTTTALQELPPATWSRIGEQYANLTTLLSQGATIDLPDCAKERTQCPENLAKLWLHSVSSSSTWRLVLLLTWFLTSNPFIAGISCNIIDVHRNHIHGAHACAKVDVTRMLMRSEEHLSLIREYKYGWDWL
ncbi:unnamed protein product [Amoebophrya sp. A25]|nr:unnamed protein product [Amoebophrya sp. A25]|eukprot:GSA25T00022921001.1